MRQLEEIKKLRKKYRLNQKELAERANVSQSLIAKLEAGKIEPSYSKAEQIFEALDRLREKEEIKAEKIMKTNVHFAQKQELVKEAIKMMKKKSISQMPVMDRGKVCGLITEGIILKKIMEAPEKINHWKVEEVMEDSPPIVSLNTGQKTLLQLLQDFPVVLVAEKGEIKGIISKSDLLGKIE